MEGLSWHAFLKTYYVLVRDTEMWFVLSGRGEKTDTCAPLGRNTGHCLIKSSAPGQ